MSTQKILRGLLMLGLLAPVSVAAQSEDALRHFFEGKMVAPRIDMPANKAGVDVHPGTLRALDYAELGKRLKEHGTAIRAGQSILITRIKVKDRNIEFHLGGGGYGTAGDDTDTDVYLPPTTKTQREKNLEKELKTVTDPEKKRKIREELDTLRREREREDARLEAIASVAEASKSAAVRQRALTGGSRFNLWYAQGISSDHLTPESVMRALAQYVDFSIAVTESGTPAASPVALRKGLLLEEVESLLGNPLSRQEQMLDGLRVLLCTYQNSSGRVEATFVEGVLVRYFIFSE